MARWVALEIVGPTFRKIPPGWGRGGGEGSSLLQVPFFAPRRRFPPVHLLRKRRAAPLLPRSRIPQGHPGGGGGARAGAEGRPRAGARAPWGRRPGAAPASPPRARGAASSPRRRRGPGAGTRRCGGQRRGGAGRGAGRTARNERERETRGGRAAGGPGAGAAALERQPEPRQKVSARRACPRSRAALAAFLSPSFPGPGPAPGDTLPPPLPGSRPGRSLSPEPARGPSRRPGAAATARGCARALCPGGGRSGACGAFLFCSPLCHARRRPKSQACSPEVALVRVPRA